MKRMFGVVLAASALLAGYDQAGAFTAQEKLQARNAAEIDAHVRLAKEVKRLWIDGIDVVRDFVSEGSARNVTFDAFIRGARFVDFDATADGLVTATAQITLAEVMRNIEVIAKSEYTGKRHDDFKTRITEKISEERIPLVITVVGYGAMTGGGGEGAGGGEDPQAAIPGSVR